LASLRLRLAAGLNASEEASVSTLDCIPSAETTHMPSSDTPALALRSLAALVIGSWATLVPLAAVAAVLALDWKWPAMAPARL